MAKKQVNTHWLLGIPALCAYLGDIDKRVCKKYFLDKGLQPVWSINKEMNYYDTAEVDALAIKLYGKKRVKL